MAVWSGAQAVTRVSVRLASKWMIGGHNHHQSIDPDRFADETFVGVLGQGDDRQFQFAVGNRDAGIFRIHEVQVKIDSRVAYLEVSQSLRQSMQADVVTGRDA